MFVCIGCGKKSNSTNSIADHVEQICNDGTNAVNEASSMDEVQEVYNNVHEEVSLLLSETEKKIEPKDSARIDDALKAFLVVCCKKAREYDCYLDTDNGLYYMDDEGNVRCGDDEPQGYHLDNPAMMFRAYNPIFRVYQMDDEKRYEFQGVTVLDNNGEVKYSDEDAEQFYNYYVYHFFYAYMIAKSSCYESKAQEIIPYLQENLFKIVCNLPLDNSYPDDVREVVNKIYYNYKDNVMNMKLYKRGYGYIEYAYNTSYVSGIHYIDCFKIYRDNNSGNIMLGGSTHGYNPPNAY